MHDARLRLERLLEDERKLLRAGRLAELPAFERRKSRLIAELAGANLPKGDIEHLRRAATRNAGLLEAAAEGIRSVLDRVRVREAAADAIETYTANGSRVRLGGRRPRHERKA
jgi:flagellar biosynthesis/type III secretory pathway chaperone